MAAEIAKFNVPDLVEGAKPDLMNDPQYVTNAGNGEDGTGDADTCRICRGEATEQEPLFFPCKCSGSIKFVHQDCLMEWLSHSQKKHCELCKTPFRFTKLYSPDMPRSLPTHVFVRHLIIHTVKNLAVWLRFCLVIFVWVGCLPWAMRHIWGFLFWFGDGGWTAKDVDLNSTHLEPGTTMAALNAQMELGKMLLNGTIGNKTSPATPLMTGSMSPRGLGNILDQLSEILTPIAQAFNLSRHDALSIAFFKSIYLNLSPPTRESVVKEGYVPEHTNTYQSSTLERSSLLSEVSFLKDMTRWPRLNGVIITTLEGQIITVLVVVCFVLVFLIREWVVQQQPGINMGAGFNADFGGERARGNRNELPDNAPDGEIAVDLPRQPDVVQDVVQREAAIVAARPIARPRRRVARLEEGQEDDVGPSNDDQESTNSPLPNNSEIEEGDPSESSIGGPQQRPRMLARGALSPAAEIQRQLAEDPLQIQGGFDAGEFVSVWRRAGGSPEEVLRIIEAEGLGEKWRYWKNAMKGLQAGSTSEGQKFLNDPTTPNSSTESLVARRSEGTTSISESWVNVPTPPNLTNQIDEPQRGQDSQTTAVAPALSSKGKGKAIDGLCPLSDTSNGRRPNVEGLESQPPLGDDTSPWNLDLGSQHGVEFLSVAARPRAKSDGPVPRENLSPLAGNYWTFSKLPEAPSDNKIPDSSSVLEKIALAKTPAHNVEVENETIAQESENPRQFPLPRDATPANEHGNASQVVNDQIEIYNPNEGSTQVAKSWDEVFNNNPVSDSEDGFEDVPINGDNHEQNPFHPDGLLPEDLLQLENRDPVVRRRQEPQGILGHVANFLWGDLDVPQDGRAGDDEHIVQDLAAEAPFVPVIHHHAHEEFDEDDESDDEVEDNQDRDVFAAAVAAGIDPNDPDGLDDVEDFEGIMELVGMRGPLTALVQNALFSAVLISLTVACGVWVPYNTGRLVILLAANPIASFKLPLKFIFGFAAVLQDLALVALGSLSFLLIKICSMPKLLYSFTVAGPVLSMTIIDGSGPASEFLRFATAAGERIANGLFTLLVQIPDSEVPAFSAVSHESLIYLKTLISENLQYVGSFITAALSSTADESPSAKWLDLTAMWATWSPLRIQVGNFLQTIPRLLATGESWVITLDIPDRPVPIDPNLSYWSGTDRFWAILAGYIAFSFLGAAYLRKGSPFSASQTGREWEASIIDVLNQAGGVMKVILIISIEMLVFPLYCGLLLDLALLPLFEDATVLSRVLFTIDSPLTSIFVHWFVGTCYMFHFALFVSMCRKIMRSGVLYFIRDPDDPTFHPVRDVLERNVATQLRKITFSAMVYGALVVVCLGGVVWGLAFAFKGVLPIHWSSNEPVLEFPIDLLFYNFFMPLAVNFFKPSDGLHAMYTWWFRRCSRMLRLTWFLFDKRMVDEEGYGVRRSWTDIFKGLQGDADSPVRDASASLPFKENPELRAYFQRDGRYVRVPASDQVRIPKGGQVFLEVDEDNNRVDGRLDVDDGPHGRSSDLFKMVYVPPYFRARIFLFILFIWLFAAVTGVCITIVPLVFGRLIFARVIPAHVRKNDVYAFSIGIYILGSLLYCILHVRQGLEYIRSASAVTADTPSRIFYKVATVGVRVARVIYTYAAFLIVIPSLFALAIEFYFILPLHTYSAVSEPHVIHFVQSWTLGLLYVKLTSRFILWHAGSRPAVALLAITQRGYLDPDVRIATRAFIFPATTVLVAALLVPFSLAAVANRYEIFGPDQAVQMLVYRYAYPFCLSLVINAFGLWMSIGVMKGWRMRIRDEVYLIGERLHNFGDRNKSGTATLIPTGNRIET